MMRPIFTLNLATTLQPSAALHLLAQEVPVRWSTDRQCLLGPGLTIRAIEKTPRGRQALTDAFGYVPTLVIAFLLDPFEATPQSVDTVLVATTRLLQREAGDAVLLLNHDTLVLQRLKRELVINIACELWNAARLTVVPPQHQRRAVGALAL